MYYDVVLGKESWDVGLATISTGLALARKERYLLYQYVCFVLVFTPLLTVEHTIERDLGHSRIHPFLHVLMSRRMLCHYHSQPVSSN